MDDAILLIDDSADTHRLVKALLSPRFLVRSAYDGKSGLAAAAEHLPDLILLDVTMPSLNGYHVCRSLKSSRLTRSIPVVFLSGARTAEERVRGLDCGACDFITKPIEPKEFLARIRATLRTRRIMSEYVEKSMFDDLTSLLDRKYCDKQLDLGLAAANRTNRPMGCILLDIDQMHVVNGAFGRDTGDSVLCAISKSLMEACRREEVLCRVGGDEFAILVPDANASALWLCAERARAVVRSMVLIEDEREIRVTASVGAAISSPTNNVSLMGEAEDALRRAKKGGGDRVVFRSQDRHAACLQNLSSVCAQLH